MVTQQVLNEGLWRYPDLNRKVEMGVIFTLFLALFGYPYLTTLRITSIWTCSEWPYLGVILTHYWWYARWCPMGFTQSP